MSSHGGPDDDRFGRLANFDAATIGRFLGAATVHEAGGSALPSRIKPLHPSWRVAGPAFPVLTPPGDNLWLHRAIEAAPAGSVIVADAAMASEFGHWGEVMSRAAQQRDLSGLVIDGGVRDGASLVDVGFPVFAVNLCVRGTSKDPDGFGSVGAPVTLGEVNVAAGDLVVGDGDGVVVVAGRDVPAVADRARQRSADEEAVFGRIAAGDSTLAIYGLPSSTSGTERFGRLPAGRKQQRSINVDGLAHAGNPIPSASRLGPLVTSGGIGGSDREGAFPPDVHSQIVNMFRNIELVMAGAGGTVDNIVRITVLVRDRQSRDTINREWVRLFPEPLDRPARHTIVYALPDPMLVQCELVAYVGAD